MPKDKSSFKSFNKSIDPYTVNKILIQKVKTLQDQNKNLSDTINTLNNTLTQLLNLVSKVIIPAVASHTAVLQYYNFYNKNYCYIPLEDTSLSQDSFLVPENSLELFKDIITEFKSSSGPKVSELPSFFDELDQDILAIANEISTQ
ncbi:10356_t:CDS:1 [Acaulospora morrowiae]|uniref:10356_t:CDS:1 n=1 Tax=Acaulospora morrowiae TaxID=94023 RepID=A0A9N9N8W1_9GLOM|nr:10356_t:CDS:1 [Acaulospora morrowiae]